MKILFLDASPLDYTALTPLQRGLGGMQSSLCFLALELASLGHEVWISNWTTTPGFYGAVRCVSLTDRSVDYSAFDVVIAIAVDWATVDLPAPMICWTGLDVDMQAVGPLHDPAVRSNWRRFVFVSQFQAKAFQDALGVEAASSVVLPNGYSSAFRNVGRKGPYFFEDPRPPRLYYASSPFRGLDILLSAFPLIRDRFPGATLDVFSSMDVYQGDNAPFLGLYEACRRMPGVNYRGSVSQTVLAKEIAECDVFAYPSTFRETSCITLMEAMVQGCLAVTHDFGALSETSAGFGFMAPMTPHASLEAQALAFAAFTGDVIESAYRNPEALSARLMRQRAYARKTYDWSHIAGQWERFLEQVVD